MNRFCLLALLCLVSTSCRAQSAADAATAVANGPACNGSFYWEIGDRSGPLVSGSVRPTRTGINRDTVLQIASASKWPYGAYIDQVRGGRPTIEDLRYLNLKSGWTKFSQCNSTDTVASCAARAGFVLRTAGKFDYGGGHMQKHAAMNGLGPRTAATLGDAVNSVLGTSFTYSSPQPAGGIRTTPAAYVTMLQRIMDDKLVAGAHLQDNAVATQGPSAIKSPVPEPWTYGRGHWIELDGTSSSPGAFGFYPWISADKTLYGIVAAQAAASAWSSVTCGREIRHAYVAQR